MKVSVATVSNHFNVLKMQMTAFVDTKVRHDEPREKDPKESGGFIDSQRTRILAQISQINELIEGEEAFNGYCHEVARLAQRAFESFGVHKTGSEDSPNRHVYMKIPEKSHDELKSALESVFGAVRKKIVELIPKIESADEDSDDEELSATSEEPLKNSLKTESKYQLENLRDYLDDVEKDKKTKQILEETERYLPQSFELIRLEYSKIKEGKYGKKAKNRLKAGDHALYSGQTIKGILLILLIASHSRKPVLDTLESQRVDELQGILTESQKQKVDELSAKYFSLKRKKRRDLTTSENNLHLIMEKYLLGETHPIFEEVIFQRLRASLSFYNPDSHQSLGECPAEESQRNYIEFRSKANRQIETALASMIGKVIMPEKEELKTNRLRYIPECFEECLNEYLLAKESADELDAELNQAMVQKKKVMISMLMELYFQGEEESFFSLLKHENMGQTDIAEDLFVQCMNDNQIGLALKIVDHANISQDQKDAFYETVTNCPDYSYPGQLTELNIILQKVSDKDCQLRIIKKLIETEISAEGELVPSLVATVLESLSRTGLNEETRQTLNEQFGVFLKTAYSLGVFAPLKYTLSQIHQLILVDEKESRHFVPILSLPIFEGSKAIEELFGVLEALQEDQNADHSGVIKIILQNHAQDEDALISFNAFFNRHLLEMQQKSAVAYETVFSQVDETSIFHRYLKLCSDHKLYDEIYEFIHHFERNSNKKEIAFQVAYYIFYKRFNDIEGAFKLLELEKVRRKSKGTLAHKGGKLLILSDELGKYRRNVDPIEVASPLAFYFRTSRDFPSQETLAFFDLLIMKNWNLSNDLQKAMKVFSHVRGTQLESKVEILTIFLKAFHQEEKEGSDQEILDHYNLVISEIVTKHSRDESRGEDFDLLHYYLLQYLLLTKKVGKHFNFSSINKFMDEIQDEELKKRAYQFMTDFFVMHYLKNTSDIHDMRLGLLGFMRIAPRDPITKMVKFEDLDHLTYQKVHMWSRKVIRYLIRHQSDALAGYGSLIERVFSELSEREQAVIENLGLAKKMRSSL